MKKIKTKLSAYLDGELDPEQVKEIELRINQNPELRSEYKRLKQVYSLLQREERTLTDPFFTTRLNVRLQQVRRAKKMTLWRYFWSRRILLSASVIAGLIVGMMLGVEIQDKILKTENPENHEIAQKYFGGKVLSTIPEGSITENYIKLSGQVK
ncbi:hypothetical protein JXQ31_11190 [candidate division KSB1 bacterium]|nr:hypothetical protein [candidate division KSB1 bacterium]